MRAHSVPGDREIARLAVPQHGVVAHRQLLGIGFGRGAIQRRIAAGRLHRLHRGVYAIGHPRVSGLARWMAAVLACGPGSLLSHRCAASLLGLLRYSGTRIDVTVVGRRHRDGVVVHRVRRLHDDDRALVHGIPVTSVARTLLDLAKASPEQLARAIEQAEYRGLFDLRATEMVLERNRDCRALTDALALHREPVFTRSELEQRFVDLCRDAGLPLPATNIWIGDQEVDAVWHGQRLVVELDGHEFHRTRAAFERDRRRDMALQLAGYRVIRVTHHRLAAEPDEVLSALRALLVEAP